MDNFKYDLRDAGGHVTSGVLQAASIQDATEQLRSDSE